MNKRLLAGSTVSEAEEARNDRRVFFIPNEVEDVGQTAESAGRFVKREIVMTVGWWDELRLC